MIFIWWWQMIVTCAGVMQPTKSTFIFIAWRSCRLIRNLAKELVLQSSWYLSNIIRFSNFIRYHIPIWTISIKKSISSTRFLFLAHCQFTFILETKDNIFWWRPRYWYTQNESTWNWTHNSSKSFSMNICSIFKGEKWCSKWFLRPSIKS